jgi:3-oxoacyl-(acyl-carrier-protein) synthase
LHHGCILYTGKKSLKKQNIRCQTVRQYPADVICCNFSNETMNSKIIIKSFGALFPSVKDVSELSAYCRTHPETILKQIEVIPLPHGMPGGDVRRMARLTRFALFAADAAITGAGAKGDSACGLTVGITHGTTSLLKEFHDYWFDYGPQMASPSAFSNGVTNAPLGAISKHCAIKAGGITVLGEEECGMRAMHYAAESLENGQYRMCCAGGTEEYSELIAKAYQKLGWYGAAKPVSGNAGSLPVLSEGSCFCVLENCPADICKGRCELKPLSGIDELALNVDLIVSGAGNGPQNIFEIEAVEKILSACRKKPQIILPKVFFGETFSAAGVLSTAVAWDVLMNNRKYPGFAFSAGSRSFSPLLQVEAVEKCSSAIVVSASRSGNVLAALLTAIN